MIERVENPRPGVPLLGVVKIYIWRDGKIQISRPPDMHLAMKMLEEAQGLLKKMRDGEQIIEVVPDGVNVKRIK